MAEQQEQFANVYGGTGGRSVNGCRCSGRG